MANTNNRVAWISILQAITIAAVVVGHIDLAGDHNPEYPIASWIDKLVQFQMPVFFFISGYLYIRSSLSKKSYSELIKSKLFRLGIPFLFITFVMFGLKLILPQESLSRSADFSLGYIVKMIIDPWNGPARHLWFLFTLFTFFMYGPLYIKSLNKPGGVAITLMIAFLLQTLGGTFPQLNCDIFSIGRSINFFPWFYLGMVAIKYDLIHICYNVYSLIICSVLYFLSFVIDIPLSGLWGIGMIIGVSCYLSKWMSNLFSNFARYSYQIYLMHIPPIMVCRMVFKHEMISNENIWFPLCWVGTLMVAIYTPVLVSKIVEKLPSKIGVLIGL